MEKMFLAFLLVQNPAPGSPPPGVVTGVVRSPAGMPAAGVRVYAIAGSDGSVLESITQTDEAGRYRLEIPPGGYRIATGSIDMPTYFPGTSDSAAARVFSITSGATVERVDFSSFVPAVRTPTGVFLTLPAGSTGVVSGTIRFLDGAPAVGVTVAASPTALTGAVAPGVAVVAQAQSRLEARGRRA